MARKYTDSPRLSPTPSTFFNRRSFLQLSATSLALPSASMLGGGNADGFSAPSAPLAHGELLPSIPRLADLASDRLVHDYRDLFTPPAVQNEWGYTQAWKSVTAITSITIPPFSCCGIPHIAFSPGNLDRKSVV